MIYCTDLAFTNVPESKAFCYVNSSELENIFGGSKVNFKVLNFSAAVKVIFVALMDINV